MKVVARKKDEKLAEKIVSSINQIDWWNKKISAEMREDGVIMTHDDNFDTFYKVFNKKGVITVEAVTPSDCRQWVSVVGDIIEVGHDGPRASGPAELLLRVVLPPEWKKEEVRWDGTNPPGWKLVEYLTSRKDFAPYIAILGCFGEGPKTFWDWYENFGGRDDLLRREEETREILRVAGYRLPPDVVSQVEVLDGLERPIVTGAFKVGSGLLCKKGYQRYEPWELPLEAVTGVRYRRLRACGIKI